MSPSVMSVKSVISYLVLRARALRYSSVKSVIGHVRGRVDHDRKPPTSPTSPTKDGERARRSRARVSRGIFSRLAVLTLL
jgi:hypothetical protein